jgi:hypothetical protein
LDFGFGFGASPVGATGADGEAGVSGEGSAARSGAGAAGRCGDAVVVVRLPAAAAAARRCLRA